ncbi:MAG: hypothetical protein QNK37_25040 [Acidobacteriota bacterium]|nr:hypothetical protein [Acidobacteriota bacterium]
MIMHEESILAKDGAIGRLLELAVQESGDPGSGVADKTMNTFFKDCLYNHEEMAAPGLRDLELTSWLNESGNRAAFSALLVHLQKRLEIHPEYPTVGKLIQRLIDALGEP